VVARVPPGRLLVFDVRDGWAPEGVPLPPRERVGGHRAGGCARAGRGGVRVAAVLLRPGRGRLAPAVLL